MADHDSVYTLLFFDTEMVADLIRGFVKEDWVRELDFDSLERVGDGYDVPCSGDSDAAWRILHRGRWLYIYLLLERQSPVDPFVGVRVMTSVGRLYQDLIRRKSLMPSGRLPPVICLVINKGKAPWRAALDVADLIEPVPGGLEIYCPRLRYALIDERQVPEMELEMERILAADLFRPGTLGIWFARVLLPTKFSGQQIPEILDPQEDEAMLEETVLEWTRQWKEEGRREGRQEVVESLREVLLFQLEQRFGEIPGDALQHFESFRDLDQLKGLGKRILTASSLEDLGLV